VGRAPRSLPRCSTDSSRVASAMAELDDGTRIGRGKPRARATRWPRVCAFETIGIVSPHGDEGESPAETASVVQAEGMRRTSRGWAVNRPQRQHPRRRVNRSGYVWRVWMNGDHDALASCGVCSILCGTLRLAEDPACTRPLSWRVDHVGHACARVRSVPRRNVTRREHGAAAVGQGADEALGGTHLGATRNARQEVSPHARALSMGRGTASQPIPGGGREAAAESAFRCLAGRGGLGRTEHVATSRRRRISPCQPSR